MMTDLIQDTQFWEKHRQELYQFILRRVSDANTAEDIVQDVLTRVYTKMETLQSKDSLHAWLYRITRNAIVDYYRRGDNNITNLPQSISLPPVEELPIDELAGCIRPLIENLPSPYRKAVQLAEIDGLKHKQIAEIQAISLSGAKSRVQRGRKLLKQHLLQCCALEFNQRGQVIDTHVKSDCDNCG